MTSVGFDILALLVLSIAGATGARHGAGRVVVYGGCLLTCISLGFVSAAGLANPPEAIVLPIFLPWTGMHLRIDALSSVFLGMLALGGAGASLFALGYGRHEEHPGRVLPFYPAFLAAMILVLVADDAFTFLFAWELMSLASWALVLAHQTGTHQANGRAATIYLLMATFSGLCLLFAFGLLGGAFGSYTFAVIRETPHTALLSAAVLIVALIGAGSKAGLVPLHVWLPLAHPVAPTQVSALMSGVMTKIAIYGFIRIVFDLLGPNAWWGGMLVMGIGGITAVLGVLQATAESDLKTLLAYSTVENIGIVFIGLGLALAFRANGFPVVAALAVTAALFHAVNHTMFKSLLFFGAGAVLSATGQRSLEALGGLIHRMPRTALAVLVGCAAISALPPLNGFASEWLTFQAILLHPELPQWGLKLMIPAVGALLALAAALAAACFVRAFGITFLGRPRTDAASQARETDVWSQAALFGFAALCLLAGILPGAVIDAMAPASQMLTGARMPIQLSDIWLTIVPVAASRSSYNGLLVFAFILISTLLTVALTRGRQTHRGPAWDCGFPSQPASAQYSAGSFEQPLRRVFATTLFRARTQVVMPPPGDPRPARIANTRIDPVWSGLYQPLGRGVDRIADRANPLQFLTIRRYLGFVFATLVILLLALTLWQ